MTTIPDTTNYVKLTTSAHSDTSIPLFAPGVTKPVAFVNPDLHLLHKTIDGRRHFVRVPPGIAFDDDVLRQARELGVVDIGVTDWAKGDRYTVTLETFLHHCETVDRGHGRQLVLRFTFWSRNGGPSEVKRIRQQQKAKTERAGWIQLCLFGGER